MRKLAVISIIALSSAVFLAACGTEEKSNGGDAGGAAGAGAGGDAGAGDADGGAAGDAGDGAGDAGAGDADGGDADGGAAAGGAADGGAGDGGNDDGGGADAGDTDAGNDDGGGDEPPMEECVALCAAEVACGFDTQEGCEGECSEIARLMTDAAVTAMVACFEATACDEVEADEDGDKSIGDHCFPTLECMDPDSEAADDIMTAMFGHAFACADDGEGEDGGGEDGGEEGGEEGGADEAGTEGNADDGADGAGDDVGGGDGDDGGDGADGGTDGGGDDGDGADGGTDGGGDDGGEGDEDGMIGIFNCFKPAVVAEIVACIDNLACDAGDEGQEPADAAVELCFPDFGDEEVEGEDAADEGGSSGAEDGGDDGAEQ